MTTSVASSRGGGLGKAIRRSVKSGLSPGTAVFIGEQKVRAVRMDLIAYGPDLLEERQGVSVAEGLERIGSWPVTWLNVNGLHDVSVIEELGRRLGWHPLTQEDIVNTTQRPKLEEFPGYLFLVFKMISCDEGATNLETEHVSVLLGSDHLVSFQEREGDVFDAVRQRIRTGKGRLRKMGADYLAFALLDAVVDHYFLAIERIGDRIEALDDQILSQPTPGAMQDLHRFKRDLLTLRKAVWPLREAVGSLAKNDSHRIGAESRIFWQDLYDHVVQVLEILESFREILGSLHDTYLSSVSNRMNEVMKVLTVIATLFMPLTFIAGIYGMNFDHMPELHWTHGYYATLGLMLAVALGMGIYFRKRGWL